MREFAGRGVACGPAGIGAGFRSYVWEGLGMGSLGQQAGGFIGALDSSGARMNGA